MGCASSHLLEDDNDEYFSHMGGPSSFSHHIVSLTSTTYGLLTLDSPQPPLPPEPRCRPSDPPEIINSWELMAGLDTDSFRFSPASKTPSTKPFFNNKENREPQSLLLVGPPWPASKILKPSNSIPTTPKCSLESFEKRCPPGGENAVIIYTTTLRGIRKTFEHCNAVRAALEGAGVSVRERDVSMHLGFREELKELLKGKEEMTVPRVFVKGRYVGGAEEVLRIHEEGCLGLLVEGLPRVRAGAVCDGCGGGKFLPCFGCHGSCKKVKEDGKKVVRCPDCNENGLVLCPICS
ncbi:Electron transporter [Cinnamomum micranthum f. kanehirae]|uniref:Electron transporter n=1 Tax=Cinnamomum micranthum f. kanehirae TaxID=337451 RepID=A0A443PFR0_9MAGN|nr:Electron transporter [Cinnamomum micranthum f. kanehirae]